MSDALAKPQTGAPISPVAAGVELPKAQLPNADDLLGAPPSADDILGPPPAAAAGGSMSEVGAVMGGPAADAYASTGGLGRVLGAFGQGVKDGWGTAPLGLDEGLDKGLKQAGIFNDVQQGQHSIIRAINEALIRPAAAAIDAAARAGSAVFAGAQAAVQQTGTELGAPNLARDIAAMPEAFFGQPGGLGMPHTPLAEARSLRVIGEGEEGWKGTAEPAPVPDSVLAATVKEHQEAAEQATGQPGPAAEGQPEPGTPEAAPAAPQDIHEAARQIAPDTFTEYDALQSHRDELRQQIAEQQETLHQNAAAQAPHAAEIADLEHRLEDTTPRLAKKYEARLADLRPDHDAFLADQDTMALLTRDTPEITALRQEMMAADYRMRDLAPDVTAAYREAAGQFPAAAEPAAGTPEAVPAVAEPVAPPEDVTAAQPKLPPVAPGETRFYHGGQANAEGGSRFLTPDPAYAEAYARKSGATGATLHYVDISNDDPHLVKAFEDEGADLKAPLMNFEAPSEIAKRLKPVAEGTQKPTQIIPENIPGPLPEATAETVPGATPQAPALGAARAPVNIASDVASKLVAAGRPAEEADASGALWAAFYDTRAKRFGGALGTAEEMYGRDAPDIVAGKIGGRKGAAGGQIRLPAERAMVMAQRGEPRELGQEAPAIDWTPGGGSKTAQIGNTSVEYGISSDGKTGEVILVKTPKELRGEGSGRAAMEQLLAEADRHGTTMFLNSDPMDRGVSKSKLDRFYRSLGFVKNMGRNKDFTSRAEFVRRPVSELEQRVGTLRGKIRLDPVRPIITLFDKADASTFVHETGHAWLEQLMQDAADERAPAQLVADGKTVRDWLGAGEDEITTRQHEKFARGFEQYMREGRAPSTALARVFSQFKEWLTRIYETVNRLGKPITPDIRDVFDRFLTHEEPGEAPVIAPEPPGREFVSPVRRTPRGTSPYEKVPREPLRLTNFLRRSFVDENGLRHAGGLRDEGGDVSATIGGPKGRPGLINNETGQNLDDAARRAWEAGYFPEHGDERPDINALKDAIAEDVQGNAQYSDQDADAVSAYHTALGQNSEIDRLAAEHGIDPKGLTRDQFFDKVAESEKAAREAIELAEMQVATHNEVREDIQDWMEHHGEPWDPEAVFGKPRTLEDLEAEDHQGDTSPQPGRDEGGGEQPVPANGPAGEGEGVSGPGGRGAGAASGAGTEGGARPDNATTGARSATGQPTGPNTPFERADTDLIDKAGNIRLDNLNQPESVNQVIREAAAENDEFTGARRGVISDAQVLDLADALGMDAKTLNQRQLGQAFNAEQVVAARKLLIQSATAVRDAMAKAASGTDADVMAYGEAKTRHQMIQEQVSGVTAEAGRALRAFRSLEGARDANAIGEFLQGAVGKTLFQLRAEAQLGMELDTPQQISKFLQDSKKASFSDMLLEYWINGLISGPATHTTYAVGNALLAMWKAVPEAAATSAIGLVRHAITGEDVRVMPGEVGAQLYGMMKGVREGIFAGWKAAKTGLTTELPGEETAAFALQYGPRGAIPGPVGTVVRLPSRGVAMIHSFFRSIGYSQAKAALAYRAAAAEGLTGEDFAARVADLSTNPSEEMMAQARDQATEQTLMGRGGEFTQTLAQLSNKPILGVPLFKFVMPFVKIGANVMSQGLLERSPIGFLDPEIRANLLGVNGPIARDTQWARVAVGTAVAGTAVGLAAQGLLTGGGPSDPKEAAIWRMTGKQPYSVRVGDTWYGIHRLGPLATILGVGADIHEFGDAVETKDASKIGGMLISSITKGLLDETWMRGPAELIQALEDPDRYGARYVRDQLSSFVPFSVGMSQMARAADPYSREARTMLDAVKNKVPFLSRTLLPRYDIWGQPMPNKDVLGVGGLSAIMESRVNNDPVNQTLLHLGIFPAQPERKIRGIELTDQQYEEFAKTAGRMTKMRLDALVGTPGFSALPDTVQSQVIRQAITTSRETARTLVMMRSAGSANDIIQQAVTNKAKLLQPAH